MLGIRCRLSPLIIELWRFHGLTSRRSQPRGSLSVPLRGLRFQVRGGSASYVRLLDHIKIMTKPNEKELIFQNMELKKEVSRLQRNNAKSEIQIFSLKREVSQLRKLTTPKPLLSEKKMRGIEERVQRQLDQTRRKLPAA